MFRILSVCFTGSMKKVIWPREAQAFRGKEQPVERTEKAASSRFFDSSAVRCDVVTHRGLTACFVLLRSSRRLLPWLPFRSPADHSLSEASLELRTDARALPGSIPRCPLYQNSRKRWVNPIFFCCMVTHRGIDPRSTPSESATLSVELMGHIEYCMPVPARAQALF